MKIDPKAAAEHDEFVTVTSAKGDTAEFKINAMTKQVFIKTAPGDGNEQLWRHCNVSYDAIKSQAHAAPSGIDESKPIEKVNPFAPASSADSFEP